MFNSQKKKTNSCGVSTTAHKNNEINLPIKKKRRSFTYKDKQKIIDALSTKSVRLVSKEYDINESLLFKWQRQKNDIYNLSNHENLCEKTKIKTSNVELDNALYSWFLRAQTFGVPVNGNMIKEKAMQLNKEIKGNQNFKASEGWLSGWKKRKNIRFSKIAGEKKSADQDGAEGYKETFANILKTKNLSRKQVFNMDESGLNYKQMPGRTFVSSIESEAADFKNQKERVTIGLCCNADGTCKLPLLIVGQSKKPRCFNICKITDIVYYTHQTNAWVDEKIFEEWFHTQFVPHVSNYLQDNNLPLRALLIVDNCRSHKFIRHGDLEITFLPQNVTSLIQPLDQGIIEMCKRNYRLLLTKSLLCAQNTGQSVIEHLKTVHISQAIKWVVESWDRIPCSTIYKCWQKIWPVELIDASTQTEDNDCFVDLLDSAVDGVSTQCALAPTDNFLNLFHQLNDYQSVDNDDILKWFNYKINNYK